MLQAADHIKHHWAAQLLQLVGQRRYLAADSAKVWCNNHQITQLCTIIQTSSHACQEWITYRPGMKPGQEAALCLLLRKLRSSLHVDSHFDCCNPPSLRQGVLGQGKGRGATLIDGSAVVLVKLPEQRLHIAHVQAACTQHCPSFLLRQSCACIFLLSCESQAARLHRDLQLMMQAVECQGFLTLLKGRITKLATIPLLQASCTAASATDMLCKFRCTQSVGQPTVVVHELAVRPLHDTHSAHALLAFPGSFHLALLHLWVQHLHAHAFFVFLVAVSPLTCVHSVMLCL